VSGLALFANLVAAVGVVTKTNERLRILADYFATAPENDRLWVIAIFSGRRPQRIVSSGIMRDWCADITGYAPWLIEECYHSVGDLAETIALLLPPPEKSIESTENLSFFLEKFISLAKKDEPAKKRFITSCWLCMNNGERYVFNKLITGSFRIGVSQKTIVNALARTLDIPANIIAHRISGHWTPSTISFTGLVNPPVPVTDFSKPYPFYLAYPLDRAPETLGDPRQWQAEWKWDGIRGQIIRRNGELFVWSRGEELITDKFPEYFIVKDLLPDGLVLDGEIIPAVDGQPLPFAVLQTRIGRKTVSKKHLMQAPISFFAYDLLEYDKEDWRNKPLEIRRGQLEQIVNRIKVPTVRLSPSITFASWTALTDWRNQSRQMGAEGIMLKRKNSVYGVGRKRGDWWKWKMDPLTIDAVLVYAQKGTGRRSNLYTDYTFAVRDDDQLVTFTKAYSGLTDKEFVEVDSFVKRNSIEKFGPVRTVLPKLVFEIAFEGIAASRRHKSGVALRFPRMSRWRKDKLPDEINTLEDLKTMLQLYGQ